MISRKDQHDGGVTRSGRPPRIVPGFSVQANLQKNTTVSPPDSRPKKAKAGGQRTMFSVNYGRFGFPVAAVYRAGSAGPRFRWLVPVESVDYATYLPILADGLLDPPVPYGACAAEALWDLLARGDDDRLLAALPRTVFPLRRALDAGPRDWRAVVRALRTLRQLTAAGRDGRVGRALVPYYRLLLRPLARYCHGNAAAGVTVTDGLRADVKYDVRDLCTDTLAQLEFTGGPCAYANIKYMVPTYENTAPAGCDVQYLTSKHHDDYVTRPVAPHPSLEGGLNVTDDVTYAFDRHVVNV